MSERLEALLRERAAIASRPSPSADRLAAIDAEIKAHGGEPAAVEPRGGARSPRAETPEDNAPPRSTRATKK